MIKESTTKYIKMFREGKLSNEALSKIVKTHGKEKFIREVGKGSEGVASNRFKSGVGIRKAYDPKGRFFSNRAFLAKDRHWRRLGNFREFASYPSAPITYHEYIAPTTKKVRVANKAKVKALLRGKRVTDIGGKVIDFLPHDVNFKEVLRKREYRTSNFVPSNIVRRDAYKHVVKKEPMSASMILRRSKWPLAISVGGLTGAGIYAKGNT